MTFTPKLYFSPGAVSMATHMALEETGIAYTLEPVLISEGQQLTERYRRVHPLGRLPAVEVELGVVLTETPALLNYLADQVPASAVGTYVSRQLLRAGTAPGASYEAAREAESCGAFARGLGRVVRQLKQARYWIQVIAEAELLPTEAVGPLLAEADDLCAVASRCLLAARAED